MPRILIADDETDITTMLKRFFESRGYTALCACCGRETIEKAQQQPDIILLDINMPDMDGLEVCRRIRDFVSCPILFLTARIEDRDKVSGFSAGGDDYIIKPFSLIELEARVFAHLRREARRTGTSCVKFSGELSIDYSRKILRINSQQISLPKKEFEIVELLSQNAGQIFDKERIYERIWGYDSDGDSTVVVEHIRRIRATLAKYSRETYIETVWGVGYKWNR